MKTTSATRLPNQIFGYERDESGALSPNEEEASVVSEIFRLYTDEKWGCSKIAHYLNERKAVAKRGGEFTQITVSRIIKCRLYTGIDNADGTGIPAIIPYDLFQKANHILRKKSAQKTAFRPRTEEYAFSGLIRCRDCGSSFRRLSRTYRNTYVKWVCMARNMNGAERCPNASTISEAELVEVLQSYFSSLLQNESRTRRMIIDRYRADSTMEYDIEFAENEIYNTFSKMKMLLSQESLDHALLSSVVSEIGVDSEGNVDIKLCIYSTLGIV